MVTTALRHSVLAVRDFRLLWAGQTVSTVGDQIFPVAVAVRVLDAGGSTGALGYVLSARFAALVAFSLVGGVWADRLPRRAVMMAADGFRAVAVLGLALVPGDVPVGWLATLTFMVGAGEAFFRPAYGAVLPELLPADRLGAGNALSSVSLRTAAIVGPGAAAGLVALAGTQPAFLLDAGSFLVSLVTLALLREPRRTPAARQSMAREVWAGVTEVRARPWMGAVMVTAAAQLMLSLAPATVLLPVITRREFGGNEVFGGALSLFSAGGLVGALVAMRWRPARPGLVGMLGLLPYTLVPVALLYPVAPWYLFVAYALAGIGLEPFIVYWQVALQREIPPDRLARVVSLDWMCSFALIPLGLALVGPAVSEFGESSVLWVAVAASAVPTLALLAVPGMLTFRTPERLDRPNEPEHPDEADQTGGPVGSPAG